jgi:hypothetical protein
MTESRWRMPNGEARLIPRRHRALVRRSPGLVVHGLHANYVGTSYGAA